MIPADFALYDALECAALAVDEAGSGRTPRAEQAWNEAVTASCRAFPEKTAADAAIGVIVRASHPGRADASWRAPLWRTLDITSLAALHAMDGQAATVGLLADRAFTLASPLPLELRAAVTVLLGELRGIARMQSGVPA